MSFPPPPFPTPSAQALSLGLHWDGVFVKATVDTVPHFLPTMTTMLATKKAIKPKKNKKKQTKT